MRFSLFPFESGRMAGGPDLAHYLRTANYSGPTSSLGQLIEIIEAFSAFLLSLELRLTVDYCTLVRDTCFLGIYANDLVQSTRDGDEFFAGISLAHSRLHQIEVSKRVFRRVCQNGLVLEQRNESHIRLNNEKKWKSILRTTIDGAFSQMSLDQNNTRLKACIDQALFTSFEYLEFLVGQKYINSDERIEIQDEFERAGDYTLYGFINAVTWVASRLKLGDEWKRSLELERLAGRISLGDHRPPVGTSIVS